MILLMSGFYFIADCMRYERYADTSAIAGKHAADYDRLSGGGVGSAEEA